METTPIIQNADSLRPEVAQSDLSYSEEDRLTGTMHKRNTV